MEEEEEEEKYIYSQSVSSLWLPGDLWAVGTDPVLLVNISLCCIIFFFLTPFQTRTLEPPSSFFTQIGKTTKVRLYIFLPLSIDLPSPKNIKAQNGIDIKETICVCVCVLLLRRETFSIYFLRSNCRQKRVNRPVHSLSISMHPSTPPPPYVVVSLIRSSWRLWAKINLRGAESPWQLNAIQKANSLGLLVKPFPRHFSILPPSQVYRYFNILSHANEKRRGRSSLLRWHYKIDEIIIFKKVFFL